MTKFQQDNLAPKNGTAEQNFFGQIKISKENYIILF